MSLLQKKIIFIHAIHHVQGLYFVRNCSCKSFGKSKEKEYKNLNLL